MLQGFNILFIFSLETNCPNVVSGRWNGHYPKNAPPLLRTVLASRPTVDKVDRHRWLPCLGKACLNTRYGSGTSPLLQKKCIHNHKLQKFQQSIVLMLNSRGIVVDHAESAVWCIQVDQKHRCGSMWKLYVVSVCWTCSLGRKDYDLLRIIRNRVGHQPSMETIADSQLTLLSEKALDHRFQGLQLIEVLRG